MEQVTFIIPAYNAAATIERTIESIAAQTVQGASECFVFDDNSSDDTYKVLEGLQEQYSFLKIFRNETGKNRGPGANRNLGIEMVKTKYLSFIDADDLLEPDWVEKMIQTAEAEQLDLLVSGYQKITEDKQVLSVHNVAKRKLETYTGSCWARLYRTQFIMEENIRFATAYNTGEDMMFVIGASSKAARSKAIEYIGYNYLVDQASLSHKNTEKGIQDKVDNLIQVISDVHASIRPDDDFGKGVIFNVMAFDIIMYSLNTPDEKQVEDCVQKIMSALTHEFPEWKKKKRQMGFSWKLSLAVHFFELPLLHTFAKMITKSAKKKKEATA